MRVVPRDTIVFGYITQIVGEGRTDTLGIFSADTVKLFAESTVVGWNVSFADYNNCLFAWNEKMDVFVGLDCAQYTRIGQGDQPWRDQHYLWAYDTNRNELPIRKLGCALTALGMVGQAYGLTTTPDTLNSYMKHTFEFGPDDSANVIWEALDGWFGNTLIQSEPRIGRGLRGSRGTPLSLDLLDSLLVRCKIVIAQVLNPRTNRNHWVLVKAKNAQGRYPIVDPGYADRLFLDESDPQKNYHNRVYRLAVFDSKN